MVSLAGLLGSGLEAASNSLVPAATNALLPAATGAVASAATNMASKTPAVAKMTLDSLLAQKRQPIGELPVSGDVGTTDLFRGQKLGSDAFHYNHKAAEEGGKFSDTIGKGYYMTPNEAQTEPWRGAGLEPIKITARNSDILRADDLRSITDEANSLINDNGLMTNLWSTDPDRAELIEALSLGRLEEVSRLANKPFIQPDSGQGAELSETVFFPDTDRQMFDMYNQSLSDAARFLGEPAAPRKIRVGGSDFPSDTARVRVRVGTDAPTNAEIAERLKASGASEFLGQPMELYHQTTASSLGDMTMDRRRAISGDTVMPEGIFLKDNDEDIGLLGKNQLKLNADIKNPAHFKDRGELERYAARRSQHHRSLQNETYAVDQIYERKNRELEEQVSKAYETYYYDKTPENKARLEALQQQQSELLDAWHNATNEIASKSRESVRNILVNNGYDSAIIDEDAGSGGRSVKSYIVFDKNQLSPRYSKDIQFDPNDAKSVFEAAKSRQQGLDEMMSEIADSITAAGDKAEYMSGGNKSIDSMIHKVERKMALGRDYRVMDMKDHMRGAIKLENLNNDHDEIGAVIDGIQNVVGPVNIEIVESGLGYKGIHLTWRDDDGLGCEIQITTPEVWATKKATDKLYDEVRNWTGSELSADPAKRTRYNEVKAASKQMWADLWKKLGYGAEGPDLKYLENYNDDMAYF